MTRITEAQLSQISKTHRVKEQSSAGELPKTLPAVRSSVATLSPSVAALQADTKRKAQRREPAKKITVDGIEFASRWESERYQSLKLFQHARQIRALACHPEFDLKINGVLVGRYTPDFIFMESERRIAEDVKGGPMREADSLRMRVFMACYPDIELRIVDQKGRAKRFKQRKFVEKALVA